MQDTKRITSGFGPYFDATVSSSKDVDVEFRESVGVSPRSFKNCTRGAFEQALTEFLEHTKRAYLDWFREVTEVE